MGPRGDLLQGMRRLRRAPGSAIVAVVTLAIGMALVTVQYTPVHRLLFDRLPFDVTGRLVSIRWSGPPPHTRAPRPRPQDLESLGRFQQSFEVLTGFSIDEIGHSVRLGDGRWIQKVGLAVLPGYLDTVGVRVKLGRPLAPEDHAPGAPPVLVVSDRMWRELGAHPSIVGQTLYFDRQDRTIIGVAEPHGAVDDETFWAPLPAVIGEVSRDSVAPLQLLAVLKPGTTLRQANADVARLDQSIDGRLTPELLRQLGRLEVVPARDGLVRREVVDFYRLMLAVSVLVLLCACANVASILLARAAERTQELAIRAALGASRRHVVWQMAGEAAPIGLLAAALGLAAAFALADVASVQASWTPLPSWVSFAVDWRIAGTVTVIALLATALAALVPALRASTIDVQAALNEGARTATAGRSGRFRSALLIGQIAVSASVLLVAVTAGLTAHDRAARPLRIDPDRHVSSAMVFPRDEFKSVPEIHAIIRSLERQLNDLGGGLTGSVSTRWGLGPASEAAVQTGSDDGPQGRPARHAAVAVNYFDALGVPVLQGRPFRGSDDASALPVAIVDANFVRSFWPGQTPLDRTIAMFGRDGRRRALRVVGVVPSLHMGGASQPDSERPGFYTPLAQLEGRAAVYPFVSGPGGQAVLHQRLVSVIRAVDPDHPPRRMRTFRAQLDEAFTGLRNLAQLYGLFGAAALVLSVVGLYGLTALTVQQRTREIGTRVALGATPARILQLFLRRCAVFLAVGLAAGAGFGAVLVWLSERRLGVLGGEVSAFALVALLLTTCAVVATLIPAARAAATSPMVAMRKS